MRLRTARANSVLRQLVGWIVAYSIALHTILVGIDGPQFGPIDLSKSAYSDVIIICHTDDGSTSKDQAPNEPRDCQFHCLICAGSAAVMASPLSVLDIAFSDDVGFGSIQNYDRPTSPLYLSERPRGPPLET